MRVTRELLCRDEPPKAVHARQFSGRNLMTPRSLHKVTLSKNIVLSSPNCRKTSKYSVLGQKSHDPTFDALVATLSKNIVFFVTGPQLHTQQHVKTILLSYLRYSLTPTFIISNDSPSLKMLCTTVATKVLCLQLLH